MISSDENILIYSILELEESGDQLLRRTSPALAFLTNANIYSRLLRNIRVIVRGAAAHCIFISDGSSSL